MKLKRFDIFTGLLVVLSLLVLMPVPVAAADPVVILLGGSGATPWAVGNIKPGDSGAQTITVQNGGTNSGDLTIWVSSIVNTEGTSPEFEAVPGTEGELGQSLLFNVTSTRITSSISMPALISALPQSAADTNLIKINALLAGETVTINWNWSLPADTGNIVQGDSLSFTINYVLEDFSSPTTTTPPPTTNPGGPPSWWPFPESWWPGYTSPPPGPTPTPTIFTTVTTTTTPTATATTPTVSTSTTVTTSHTTTPSTPPVSPTPTATPGVIDINIIGTLSLLEYDAAGRLTMDYYLRDATGLVDFYFAAGTCITTATGTMPWRIEIRRTSFNPLDGERQIICMYEIVALDEHGQPMDVSFDPPIRLTLTYLVEELPAGATAVSLVYYDDDLRQWVNVEIPPGYGPVVIPVSGTGEVAGLIYHLSLYGIQVETANSPSGTACQPAIWWLSAAALAIVILGVSFWLWLAGKRRRHEERITN